MNNIPDSGWNALALVDDGDIYQNQLVCRMLSINYSSPISGF